MRIKVRSSLIIVMLILSVLIVGVNFGIIASTPPSELGTRSPPSTKFHTWSNIQVLSEPIVGQQTNIQGSYNPKVAVENDKIYVVWADDNSTGGSAGDRDIFYRYHDGSSWSEVQIISEPEVGNNFNTQYSHQPDIAVENGKIYVVWYDYNNTDSSGADADIHFRCNLTGSSWEDIQVISEPIFGADNNDISYNPTIAVENDNIYVTWGDETNYNGASTDADIFYRCNLTGTSWEDMQVISEPVFGGNLNNMWSYDASIAVENNKLYVIWEDLSNFDDSGGDTDIFYICNLTGNAWEDIQVISEPNLSGNINTGGSYDATVAVENGKIYTVWEDESSLGWAGNDEDIFYRCNTTGTNWDALQVISEPVFGQNFDTQSENDPVVAVEDDKIHVAWESGNNTNFAGFDDDIAYRMNITGKYWEPIEMVSEPEEYLGYNNDNSNLPDIVVDDTRAYVVWTGINITLGSGTDDDIFFRMTYGGPILTGSVTPTFGNTSTSFNFSLNYRDKENQAPGFVKLLVNGSYHKMLELNPADTNYKNGKDYFLELAHLDVRIHNALFIATDGKHRNYIRLWGEPEVENTPPEITNNNDKTAVEDEYYEVDYNYNDRDVVFVGQQGTWSLNTAASWLTIEPTTGILSGQPSAESDIGTVWVNVTIDDGWDIDWTKFQLTVTATNDPPDIGPEALPNAIEDELYNIGIDISDVDTPFDGLDWTITTNANWLKVTQAQRSLNGTPLNEHVGEGWWIKVVAEDGVNSAMRNYSFAVENTNDAPDILTEPVTAATVGEYYAVDYEAIDIDPTNDTITWSLKSGAGTWLEIDEDTGWLHGTPMENNIGEHSVSVIASDGMDSSAQNFILTIEPVYIPNENPTIITEDVLTATAGDLYYVIYEAIDDRTPSKDLSWTWQGEHKANLSWLDFNTDYRVLSGTPAKGDAGTWKVNVSVTDDEGGSDYHNFVINVTLRPTPPPPPPSNNTKPELSNGKMEPEGGDENTEFTFSVHYQDDDGEPPSSIKAVVDGEENDMTLKSGDSSDGDYEYKTKLPKGSHSYYFTANDGEDDAEPSDETPTGAVGAELSPSVEGAEGDKKEAGFADWIIWIVLVVIIIIVLAVIFFLMTRRKPAADYTPPPPPPSAAAEEEEAEWEEEEDEE